MHVDTVAPSSSHLMIFLCSHLGTTFVAVGDGRGKSTESGTNGTCVGSVVFTRKSYIMLFLVLHNDLTSVT